MPTKPGSTRPTATRNRPPPADPARAGHHEPLTPLGDDRSVTRHRPPLAALLVALGLLAAACSGSSSGTTSAGPTRSAAAPTSTTAAAGTASDAPSSSTTTTAPVAAVDPEQVTVHSAVATTARAVAGSLQTPDGRTRTYHVYVPTSLPADTPVPLLLALHGGGGWGQQFEKNSGYDGLAEANGFIVVYPDGIGSQPQGDQLRTWNGGDCCGLAARQDVHDVAFVDQLIDRLEAEHPIDAKRVFATGHSNGGILAYRLACELSDRIAAIGVQSSALEVDTCHPSQPVSVLHIHGTADQNIPIAGGIGPNAHSGVAFHVPLDGATTLAAADRCPARPTTTHDPANADLTIRQWAPCAAGTTVAFVEVAGASHAYMGHDKGGSGKTGPVYQRLDSSLQIWNFLAQHPRR